MLQVTLEQREKETRLLLSGPMDEGAGAILSTVLPHLREKVTIDFQGLEYFNSLGIRTWVNFLRSLREGRVVSYEHCPMELIQQIDMMPALSQGVIILSFYADFTCQNCGFEKNYSFSAQESKANLLSAFEKVVCEKCGNLMRIQDDPESFLTFIKEGD